MESIIWTYVLLVLAVNAGFSAIVAYVAKQKGRSSSGFFWLSFFLSFFVGILVVLALPKKEEHIALPADTNFTTNSAGEELVKCPFCAEWVKSEAKVCKYCKSDIEKAVSDLKLKESNEALAAAELQKSRLQEERVHEQELAKQQKLKRKEDFKTFTSSKPFFIGLTLAILAIVAISIAAVVSAGEEQKKSDAAQEVVEQKENQADKASKDWSYALSLCKEDHPTGIEESGTTLSEDGNSITIANSSGSNFGVVGCILKYTVDDPRAESYYWKSGGWGMYVGEPLPLEGNVTVIIEDGQDAYTTGQVLISR